MRRIAQSVSIAQTVTIEVPPEARQLTQEIRIVNLKSQQSKNREKILSLLDDMRRSQLFSNMEAKIQEWATKFQEMDLEKDDVAVQLFRFLDEVIRFAIDQEPNFQNQENILKFEDQLTKILPFFLPKGVSADEFIEQQENFLDDEVVDNEIVKNELSKFEQEEKIKRCFKEQSGNFLQAARSSDQEHDALSLILRTKALSVNGERKVMSEQVNGAMISLTDRVDEAGEQIYESAEEVVELGTRMQAQQTNLKNVLNYGISVFKKV